MHALLLCYPIDTARDGPSQHLLNKDAMTLMMAMSSQPVHICSRGGACSARAAHAQQ